VGRVCAGLQRDVLVAIIQMFPMYYLEVCLATDFKKFILN